MNVKCLETVLLLLMSGRNRSWRCTYFIDRFSCRCGDNRIVGADTGINVASVKQEEVIYVNCVLLIVYACSCFDSSLNCFWQLFSPCLRVLRSTLPKFRVTKYTVNLQHSSTIELIMLWGAENAGPENAGRENTGPVMSSLWEEKCSTGKCGTKYSRAKNEGQENEGLKMQALKMQDMKNAGQGI